MKEAGVFSCSYAYKERDFLIFSSQVKNWSTESLMFDFNSWPLTVRPGNGRMPTDESTPSRVPWTTCPWSILAVKEIKVMRMRENVKRQPFFPEIFVQFIGNLTCFLKSFSGFLGSNQSHLSWVLKETTHRQGAWVKLSQAYTTFNDRPVAPDDVKMKRFKR